MPQEFTDQQLVDISTSLLQLAQKHNISFFVFSTGANTDQAVKQVVTFTGHPDKKNSKVEKIEIAIEHFV